jgi:hypothetical protein
MLVGSSERARLVKAEGSGDYSKDPRVLGGFTGKAERYARPEIWKASSSQKTNIGSALLQLVDKLIDAQGAFPRRSTFSGIW